MNKTNISKQSIVIIGIIFVLIIAIFVSCSKDDQSQKQKKTPNDLFGSTEQNTTNTKKQSVKEQKNTTVPTYQPTPFSQQAKQNLYSLPTTGEIDATNPQDYVSPRWEAILGGDTSSGIPRSELNNPINSDLDVATFQVARTTAINVTDAQITGNGAGNYLYYFNDSNQPGTCTNFKASDAGATSLPIANDHRWIIATVFWSATCGTTPNTYQVSQQTPVYFTVDNSALTIRQLSEIPKG